VQRIIHPTLICGLAMSSLLFLSACRVSVDAEDVAGGKHVEVQTPLGHMSVRSDTATRTGVPVYPAARLLRDGEGTGAADVEVGNHFVDVKVIANRFASDDTPERVAAFYRDALGKYGSVTECRGNIDFRPRGGSSTPVCRGSGRGDEIQLVVGTEQRHRVVAVKPRGTGSEFAVVYIQTHT
jgi:hypothetical protein